MVVAAACGSGTTKPSGAEPSGAPKDDHFFENFKKAVEDAEDDGYRPYWLGRGFEAGGVTFDGPNVTDFFDGTPGGGVRFSYGGFVPPQGRVVIHFDEYSPEAWSMIEPLRAGYGGREIVVAGHSGKLRIDKGSSNAPSGLVELVLSIGNTVVVVTVSGGRGRTDGAADPNPLTDEATFLSMMENLRPYPD